MTELVSIREAARRLGVSDTAVHKAIDAGRVSLVPGENPKRPKMDWADTERRWFANSDSSKRSHVGPQGSKRREADAPRVKLPLSSAGAGPASAGAVVDDPGPALGGAGGGPSYAQSRAIREAFNARIAKLDFEERSGKLVAADDVKIGWFKLVTAAKTKIMGIPAACKSRAADLPLSVVAIIDEVCRQALEDLANGKD